jgi:hypothetical protein
MPLFHEMSIRDAYDFMLFFNTFLYELESFREYHVPNNYIDVPNNYKKTGSTYSGMLGK